MTATDKSPYNTRGTNASPSKTDKRNSLHNETKQPPRKTVARRTISKKKDVGEPGAAEILQDPQSVMLMNSFLIKNAGPCFENFHKSLQANKRKFGNASAAGATLG